MRQSKVLLAIALLLVIAVGCDNDSPTAPVLEEPDPVPTVTDEFTGELMLGQTSCHVFSNVNPGAAELMITSLAPLQTLTVGLGLGRDDGDPATDCSYFATDSSVRVGDTLQSRLVDLTTYCVCIFDVGNIFPDQTVRYVLQVEHP